MKYSRAKVSGLNIFYREAGDPSSPAMILFHGFPSSSHMFRDLIPMIAGKFHVIAPDFPGFGQSDMPSRDEFTYSFDNIAEAVENLAQHAAAILEDAKKSSDQVESLVVVMESLEKNGKDVAAETESVSAATEEQSASIDEVATASKKLSELAGELTESASQFKIFKGADRLRAEIKQ